MANQVEIFNSFSQIDPQDWEKLDRGDFIFADHAFFTALEEGGSLGRRTGWYPQILVLRDEDGTLLGAAPLFLKTNSYGEYIFDWAWANASQASGISYYPKLVSAIPFTPATGPKLLVARGAEHPEEIRAQLSAAALEHAKSSDANSIHHLFITQREAKALESEGFAIRHSYQFHWQNDGYKSFDDFLAALRSKRRTEIRREREAVRKLPITIRCLTGDQLTLEHARAMHAFYASTVHKMGGHDYLTLKFFELAFERMKNQILLVMAFEGEKPVAGAMNYWRGKTLFGRHWGCFDDYRNLHFELCYYQTVEWAIINGIDLFEAGAQGEQKFNRGFIPNLCYSAHELFHPQLDRAVRNFIEEEKSAIDSVFCEYKEHNPFKRLDEPGV